MNGLDKIDSSLLVKLDPSGMGRIIAGFPAQCRQAVEIAGRANIRLAGRAYRNIVICGMGGSAIAGDILASYLSSVIDCAVHVQRNYGLPGWVNSKDLVIASSYSGETEETLSGFDEALKRSCTIAAVTSGGILKRECEAVNISCITIPGGLPPRGALGYSFFTLLGLLASSGIVPNQDQEIQETLLLLEELSEEYSVGKTTDQNPAKKQAESVFGHMPVIYASSDLLSVVARRWANQLNENAKVLSYWAAMPELCHNEIVGWEMLPIIREKTRIIMLQDDDDHERNRLRFEVLHGIINQRSAGIDVWRSRGRSRLSRIFSLLYAADFISYYLALLNQVDPMPVKMIDKLKSVLKDRK